MPLSLDERYAAALVVLIWNYFCLDVSEIWKGDRRGRSVGCIEIRDPVWLKRKEGNWRVLRLAAGLWGTLGIWGKFFTIICEFLTFFHFGLVFHHYTTSLPYPHSHVLLFPWAPIPPCLLSVFILLCCELLHVFFLSLQCFSRKTVSDTHTDQGGISRSVFTHLTLCKPCKPTDLYDHLKVHQCWAAWWSSTFLLLLILSFVI